jgi:hypothetical protein
MVIAHLATASASTAHQDVSQNADRSPSSHAGACDQMIIIENPTPHRLPEGENATPLEVIGTTASDKLIIIMVGLPATGTFLGGLEYIAVTVKKIMY